MQHLLTSTVYSSYVAPQPLTVERSNVYALLGQSQNASLVTRSNVYALLGQSQNAGLVSRSNVYAIVEP